MNDATITPLTVVLQAGSLVSYDVLSFRVERALGGVAEAVIDVHFPGVVEPDDLLGAPARLAFGRDAEEHAIDGVVAALTLTASPQVSDDRGAIHRVHLTSALGLLQHDVDCQIFQDKDVKEIVTQVLTQLGVDAGHQSWRRIGSYAKRETCVRYNETAFAFVSRLLEEEGIYCHSESSDQGEVIAFEDDSTTSPPIDGDATIPYRDGAGLAHAGDSIGSVTHRRRTATGKVTLRDYDFKKPKADLTASAAADVDADVEAYDYPGLYTELDAGKRLAKVRLEALQAERATFEIRAACPRLIPGRTFTLAGAPHELDGDYFLTRTVHTMRSGVYEVVANLVPKKVPYRLPRRTPAPIIHGPQTAVVVAPAGSPPEEIHTDEHGRCKVLFHWDRYAAADDKASCWMRVAQLQTSGSMILPRVGWEVIVEFLEGNPDRPIITGRVYNGRYMPPYALPEGKSRTAIQTASSPGGKGRNEIRMEDKAGSEEMKVQSQKDTTLATANNKTVSTAVDASKSVGVNSTTTIGADQSIKVTNGYKNTVGGSQTVSVGGNRTAEVNAVYGLTSGGASASSIGGKHFEMDGNPLQGLLSLAVKTATEAAKAEAEKALQQLDQAVQSKVDQVMGPINQVQQQAEQVKAGMDAVSNGDLSGAADAFGAAAGMPGPDKFAGDLDRDGADPGGERGMDATPSGEGGGGGGGGVSKKFGLDALAKGAIEKGSDALGKALGVGGDGGGGESEANVAGPDGAVAGNSGGDSATGPGHSINVCSSTHSEKVGSVKATIAAGGINTTINGARTQKIGAARVELVGGTRAETCVVDKKEKAVGLVVISGAAESEQVGGARSTMVGGAILEKIGAGCTVTAAGKAMFVGAFHKVDAASAIVFKCKSSEVVIDGGGVTIKAPLVTISASTIKQTKAVSEA
jgi:type VI secretion system secreted protein VgrG